MSSSKNRQRLKPWLMQQINSGKFPGLEWMDRDEQIFRIPWRHGGKHDWMEKHSVIFKEYAVHTGRFHEGDKPNYAVWKTRLRCAMTKSHDIQELSDQHVLSSSDPYKVYRFTSKHEGPRNRAPEVLDPSLVSFKSQQSPVESGQGVLQSQQSTVESGQDVLQENGQNIPLHVMGLLDNSLSPYLNNTNPCPAQNQAGSLERDLGYNASSSDISSSEDSQCSRSRSQSMLDLAQLYADRLKEEAMDINANDDISIDDSLLPDPLEADIQRLPVLVSPKDKEENESSGHTMILKIWYQKEMVGHHAITNPYGCRLCYGSANTVVTESESYREEAYGSANVDEILFPSSTTYPSDYHKERTETLFKSLHRGIVLECVDGDIFVTRKSKCSIFVSSPSIDRNLATVKLPRDKRTKIYDYQEYFLPLLDKYVSSRGKSNKPCTEVLISFGQNWRFNFEPQKSLFVSATVMSDLAERKLKQVCHTSLLSTSLEASKSDNIDSFLNFIKDMEDVHL